MPKKGKSQKVIAQKINKFYDAYVEMPKGKKRKPITGRKK